MRLGVIVLPEQRWADAAHRWRRLDEWGFDTAWTYDHLAWRSLAYGPWFATVPTLTAAALAGGRMDSALADAGRSPGDLERYLSLDASGAFGLSSVDHLRDAVGRAQGLGFTEVVVHWPRADGVYEGSEAVLEAVATELLPERHTAT